MEFYKREKYLFYIVVILSLIFFLQRFLLGPLKMKLFLLEQDVLSQELKLKKALILQSQKEAILSEYEDYEDYLRIEATFPEEAVAKLLNQIEKMARESKGSLVDIKPRSKAKEMGDYRKYDIEIDLRASMEQIIDFLYRLQTSGLLLRVEEFSISPRDKTRLDVLKAKMVITRITIP